MGELAASTPAGRLREVLRTFYGAGGPGMSVSQRWDQAASSFGSGIDGVSARAEAGALLREIELATAVLPEEDDPSTLLAKRDAWARPIFNIGINDTSALNIEDIRDDACIVALLHLHSILRRDTPEFKLAAGSDAKGGALRRAHFNNLTRWVQVARELGVPGLHFHDLRHTGNLLAAQTGASTKDLMSRMGHDDMRAALIYQRATSEADRLIADRLSELVDEHREEEEDGPDDDEDGLSGALVPVG